MLGKSFEISEDTISGFAWSLLKWFIKSEKDVYYKIRQVRVWKSKFTEINSSSRWPINFWILKMDNNLNLGFANTTRLPDE